MTICTYQSQAPEDQMKEGDDWMLQSPRRVVTKILEVGVIHERTGRIVHIPSSQLFLSVTVIKTILLIVCVWVKCNRTSRV